MISDERITTYIHSLESPESGIIERIEQEALEQSVPIIRKETQSFQRRTPLLLVQPGKKAPAGAGDRNCSGLFGDFNV